MRNTLVTGILLASLLVTAVPNGTAASGDNGPAPRAREPKSVGGGSAVAGTFTGTLYGSVSVGGRLVLITKKTTIFEAGSGAVERRVRVADAPVYITGKMRRGVLVADVIVINGCRSPNEPTALTGKFTTPKEGNVAH